MYAYFYATFVHVECDGHLLIVRITIGFFDKVLYKVVENLGI